MTIDWDLVVKVAGPLAGAGVGAWAKTVLEGRPRVTAFLHHAGAVHLRHADPPYSIGTHTVVLRNTGKKAARNVKLGHAILPSYSIFPDIEHTVAELPSGQREIRIPTLVPEKQITICYVYTAPTKWVDVNTHLDHDDGPVKVLNVLPTVQWPRWLYRSAWAVIFVGLVTIFYWMFKLIAWVAQNT